MMSLICDEVLGNMEYQIIAIAALSTLTSSGSTW